MYTFYDAANAHGYLSGSMVIANKKPVVIMSVDSYDVDVVRVYYHYKTAYDNVKPSEIKTKVTDLTLKGFDLKPVQLGLFNTGNDVVRAYRIPSRQWKMGLTKRNTTCRMLFSHRDSSGCPYHMLDETGFREMLVNKYTPRRAVEMSLRDDVPLHRAVSKQWMLSYNGKLGFYQIEQSVGFWRDGYVLLPQYQFLQQALDKMLYETDN